MSIVIAILVFGFIIAIHELGHFFVAKACGVTVNEFAIGMGPAILKSKKKTPKSTQYSLRLFPIGGYCSMEGEDETSEDEGAFNNKKVWQRMLIIVAGAFMNLLLGLIVVIIMVSTSSSLLSTTVSGFAENAKSAATGLQANDRILKVNKLSILTVNDLSYALQTDDDGIFDMIVERNGEKVRLLNVTFDMKKNAENKSSLIIDFGVGRIKKNPVSVVSQSFKSFGSTARMIWLTLGDLIKGKYGLNDLSGPVGIVSVIDGVVSQPKSVPFSQVMQDLLYLMSFITINVGIFNLLPLPALDGGRLVFLCIEGIRRKPIKPEHEGMVHFIGIALLLVLMLVVTVSDILKLF